jgi:epoxyqueuosine reductase QueG
MFARASWGQDYHTIMRKRLDQLATYIQSIANPSPARSATALSDNTPVSTIDLISTSGTIDWIYVAIIAIAVGYPNKLKGAPKSVRGDRRGMFARASWGQDYHTN